MPSFANPTNDAPAFGPAGRPASGGGVEYLTWRAIDASLLHEGRRAVPEFPLARLPQPWRDWVAATARSAGAPADYVGQALFAAVAGVCGAGVAAEVTPSWSEPLVLWQALLGGPSSGKSPALAAVRRLLVPIEDALRRDDDKRHGRHVARAEQARQRTERWREECHQAAEMGAVPPPMPPDSTADHEFVPARIMVEKSSVAALGDAVSANPRGVILWRDRPSDWPAVLGGSARGRNEGRSERACWLEAWNAGEIALERRSHGAPRRLARFAVSVIGSLHPERLAEQLSGSEDGLAARLLFSWPDTPPYCSLRERRPGPDGEAFEMLRRIAGAAGTPDEPLSLRFDEGALDSFDGFLAGLHAEIRNAEGLEAGWLGKGAGTVVRLAACLALLAWSGRAAIDGPPGHVGRQEVEDAAALWTGYFRPHARAVFNHALPATDRERRARRVARWLADTGRAEVSRKEIRCEALGDTANAAEADQVITRLSKAGILRLHVVLSSSSGGRPTRRWLVNPALREDADG
jgi:hypothetical protein